jgi:hypothetical protein
MSEYHDTNEDERDWDADKRNRHASGVEIAETCLDDCPADCRERVWDIIKCAVMNTGDQWKLAGFLGLPYRRGGYDHRELHMDEYCEGIY